MRHAPVDLSRPLSETRGLVTHNEHLTVSCGIGQVGGGPHAPCRSSRGLPVGGKGWAATMGAEDVGQPESQTRAYARGRAVVHDRVAQRIA